MKLSKWIRCDKQQPTIPGWYDVKYHGDESHHKERRHWSGEYWEKFPAGNKTLFGNSCFHSGDAWRGLAKEPK